MTAPAPRETAEGGHTLAELAVATVLLLVLLAPLGAALVRFGASAAPAAAAEALDAAEAVMETTLARGRWTPLDTLVDARWRVRRRVRRLDGRAVVTVEATRVGRAGPRVVLVTLRPDPDRP